MSWTKMQLISQAFSEIGLAGYVFDLTPEQLESAMRQLDAMMATWNGKGIKLGYPTPTSPENGDLDQETNLPLDAAEAVYLNLGIRLASSYGKVLMPETKANAKMAYDSQLAKAAKPKELQFPDTVPAGAGNKPWRTYDDPFLRGPNTDPLDVEDNGQLTFLGD